MIISDKYALDLILQQMYQGTNSYAYLFLRAGDGSDIPTTLADLAASAHSIVALTAPSTTIVDNQGYTSRWFPHYVTYKSYGGYGAKSQIVDNGAYVDLYQVYPVTIRKNFASSQTVTAASYTHLASSCLVPSGVDQVFDNAIYDFGQVLKFRRISLNMVNAVSTNTAVPSAAISYYDETAKAWVALTALANGHNDQTFSAQKIQITPTIARQINSIQFNCERGNDFDQTPITHGVLVSSGSTSLSAMVGDMDYIGVVLDVGSDIFLDRSKAGSLGAPDVQSFYISSKALSIEAK